MADPRESRRKTDTSFAPGNRHLTKKTLCQGLEFLCAHDPDLGGITARHGPPPLWARKPGFSTLVRIILEQQVSLASAKAAHDRLVALVSPLIPERFLELDGKTLKRVGFSRQKTDYCRSLANALLGGQLQLDTLGGLDDASVRSELMKIKGIGYWTADIYMVMALRRPDVWPSGDLALAVAVQNLKRLKSRPTPDDLNALSLGWRPWRAVAARVLWHYYLSELG